jgi:glycosyltransferase involved in cell wall biosynthesis
MRRLRGCFDFSAAGIFSPFWPGILPDERGMVPPLASETGEKSRPKGQKRPRTENSKQPLRVAFVVNSLYGGGAERALQLVLRNLDRAKFDITVISNLAEEVNELYPSDLRYRFVFRRWNGFGARVWNKIRLLVGERFGPGVFRQLFLRRRFDVEVAFIEGYATRIVAGGRSARKIAWVHTDMENNPWGDIAFRSEDEQRACYECFDRVVCVTRAAAEVFEHRFGVEATVAYNPVDAEEIRRNAAEESAPTRLPAPPDGPTLFVSVGRLVEQKGFDRLIDIVGRLRDGGHDLRLWIVGEGARREFLERMIAEKNLADVVTLWGFRGNPYPLVAAADWFVMSSRVEGYGLVMAESLIVGTPVVATECCGTREILGQNGEWGVIAENSDQALLEAMRTVIENPSLRDEYQRKATQRGACFSLPQQITIIEKLLNNE